ncbi:hypothetical Cell wall-associated hydrolase [Pedobacter sp. BAL39]|uniref:C40 family peptidase n=1 Tax=Pedobacter sp. BAL39 TaxID=391596 RepID=UPI0001559F98|nr:C40 family peptidase [Pedobacter sp. BAL39]EDM38740.1 hypothetical Cell wall-associated hydrolase [Pedobacter sp. BAL39]
MKKVPVLFIVLVLCAFTGKAQNAIPLQYQEMVSNLMKHLPTEAPSEARSTNRLLDFAKSMIGIPYRYASSNPKVGFDCSGFVSYVFQNFGFRVPRSSREFATKGEAKKLEDARIGDVIIFTGTNSRVRRAGHVGIVYSIDGDEIKFIHSSSGNKKGVTITSLNEGFYKKRFMKIVSIL